MIIDPSSKLGPRCNSVIQPDSPGGLCPKCLLEFVAFSSSGGATAPHVDRNAPNLEDVRSAFPQLEILEVVGQGGVG
ncbi:MAG: hypothetical protein ABL921_26300, partial [Pirellula sp.]